MSKNCEFRDYPFCTGDCFTCYYDNIMQPRFEVLVDSINSRVQLNNQFRDKVKVLVDERRQNPTARNSLEVSKSSLYHLLKRMEGKSKIIIDFFINNRWKFSSVDIELFSVEECLNFLPDELIQSNCEIVSEKGVTKVNVNL